MRGCWPGGKKLQYQRMRPRDKIIRYQEHALGRMSERGISKKQVEQTIWFPDCVRTANRPGAKRFEKKFSPRRRITVIAEEFEREFWVISAFK